MSEDLYTEPGIQVHFDQDEKDVRIVDIYVSAESLTVYENPWVEGISPPNIQSTAEDRHPVPAVNPEKRNPSRAAAALLVLLCLLLLAVIIVLGVLSSEDKTRWTLERNQMQDSYRKLLTNNSLLIKEREELLRLCDERDCPDGWQRFRCSCYYVSTSKETQRKGRKDCKDRDADLVIISSKEEQEFLSRTALPLNRTAWIDLILRDNQGVWRWMDATPQTTERYWPLTQSDDNGGSRAREDCVVIIKPRDEAADWWERLKCWERANWICERRIQ